MVRQGIWGPPATWLPCIEENSGIDSDYVWLGRESGVLQQLHRRGIDSDYLWLSRGIWGPPTTA